ncbi:ATP-binding protein [Planomonospora corallina]|uniref:ATP-binding protein n=1 Tax=Planomonospora corallina TaxID=1806052 RepID=A0ABV8I996_9ACTN
MIPKPDHVFARDAEWSALSRFAESRASSTRLGVVSGRRRQGKTFLLNALAEAVGGFYFVAADDTETEGLRRFGEALAFHTGGGGQYHFANWDQAIERLYATVTDGIIVIDEFPYLAKASPVLPSLFQRALDPGGTARRSAAKLLLCGSAMPVMGELLAGDAPLRGRASLELVVNPMDYLTAARFWGCEDDHGLAVLLHSVVGGTPAYRHEPVYSDTPVSDPAGRTSIQVDVAALAPGEPGRPARLLALGEAKWGKAMGLRHLDRLRRARDLLAVRKYDTEGTRLICYSGAGFDAELRTAAASDGRTLLIDLPRL